MGLMTKAEVIRLRKGAWCVSTNVPDALLPHSISVDGGLQWRRLPREETRRIWTDMVVKYGSTALMHDYQGHVVAVCKYGSKTYPDWWDQAGKVRL